MKKILLGLLCVFGSALAQAPCKFDGMIGECPEQTCRIREILKRVGSEKRERAKDETAKVTSCPRNRLLIYGDPGNGKTTVVRRIIAESFAGKVEITGGAFNAHASAEENLKTVQALIDEALTIAQLEDRGCVVQFEEIEHLPEHVRGVFNYILDDTRYQDEGVEFIFTTNNIKALRADFIDRFGGRTAKMENPEAHDRLRLLSGFCEKERLPLSTEQLKYLQDQTDGLSLRSIMYLVSDIGERNDGDDPAAITTDEFDLCVKKQAAAQEDYHKKPTDRYGKLVAVLAGTGVVVSAIVKIVGRDRVEKVVVLGYEGAKTGAIKVLGVLKPGTASDDGDDDGK